MSGKYLAFDLGAESGRAVLGRLENGRLTLEERHRFANPNGRLRGHLHWDLLAQWEELKTALRKTASDQAKLDGLGVDTWGVDFGLIDTAGDLLGLPFMYRDSRTDGVMDEVLARVGRQRIFQATGIQFMQFNTLFQLVAMMRDNPGMLNCARALLFIPDLFNYLFTGVAKCEYSIASTSQMIDPRRRSWAGDLLDTLELPKQILPELLPSGSILGPLDQRVAAECGIAPMPVIAPASHDTASAVAAVPAQGDSWCYISSGTWSLMGVELSQPLISDKALKYNYTNEGGVGDTVRLLKNIMGLWLVQECRRQFRADGHEFSYAELTRLAAEAPPRRWLVDPDHLPFLSPGQMPRKIAEFCRKTGQPVPEAPGQFIRVCLDSLALAYRATLAGLEDLLGRRIDIIHIVGGGVQNELLTQMTADACARPVVAGPIEATAIGNILVQAMASGHVQSLAQARGIVRQSFEVKRYEPRETASWDEAFHKFQSLKTNL